MKGISVMVNAAPVVRKILEKVIDKEAKEF